MEDASIKTQIHHLVEVQKIDSEIYDLKTLMQEKPLVVQQLKNEFEEKKSGLHQLEEKSKQIQAQRKATELDLNAKEETIRKANTQLFELKTNKEYSAKLSEIENIKADKSVMEEQILLSFEKSDQVGAEIDKEKKVLAVEEATYLAKKKEVDEEMKQIQDRLQVLEGQRKQLIGNIEPSLLPRYEQLISRRQGLAIVPIIGGNACGGCHMDITMQQINAVKIGETLTSCEFCNRMLYLEDHEE